MPSADDAPDGFVYTPRGQLHHDLKSPLTTILERAELLARDICRSPSLKVEERARMFESLAATESAVQATVITTDGLGGEDADLP